MSSGTNCAVSGSFGSTAADVGVRGEAGVAEETTDWGLAAAPGGGGLNEMVARGSAGSCDMAELLSESDILDEEALAESAARTASLAEAGWCRGRKRDRVRALRGRKKGKQIVVST